jgi:hypothetical protein
MRMTALAAGVGAAMAGGPDEANAQETEMMLPHPDGEIVIDVTRVALETQSEILTHLQACLGEGFAFADADENGKIEGEEQFDWDDERGHCAEVAEQNFKQAGLQNRIDVANADQAALREQQDGYQARIDAAKADMQALTDGVIADAQNEG